MSAFGCEADVTWDFSICPLIEYCSDLVSGLGSLAGTILYDFSCKGVPEGRVRDRGLQRAMEVTMTMHSDHHATDTRDNGTALAIWMLIGLFAVAAVALWFYAA